MTVRILIAGGGVAALEAALALRALAAERVAVELFAPEPYFWYRPLAVAEPFGRGEARHFELAELASAAGATFTLARLGGVDAEKHEALTSVGNLSYDILLVAIGAVPVAAVPGALTFRGPADSDKIRGLLEKAVSGVAQRIAFAVPGGAVWSLPAYELALMTAQHLAERGVDGVELSLVTPEERPLHLFGGAASDAARQLLGAHKIQIHTGCYPSEVVDGELQLVPAGSIAVDAVVALPRLKGPPLDGLSQTLDGFIPVDAHGRVRGLEDVFAAGDVTNFPVKQGGIAAQQADAVAEAIAVSAGADLDARPFRPVLRGLLLTGAEPRYLRRELASRSDDAVSSPEPLWWPPAKIVGRRLAPFLAELVSGESLAEAPVTAAGLPVAVELDADAPATSRLPLDDVAAGGHTVDEVMVTALVVAPEDTLGEVAEKMRAEDVGSAAVADHGRLIGILTSRDLLNAFAGRVHPSEARVREWMTAEPVTANPETPVGAAVTLMTEYGIHHLPVVEGERPVGMVGLRQAARASRRSPVIGLGF